MALNPIVENFQAGWKLGTSAADRRREAEEREAKKKYAALLAADPTSTIGSAIPQDDGAAPIVEAKGTMDTKAANDSGIPTGAPAKPAAPAPSGAGIPEEAGGATAGGAPISDATPTMETTPPGKARTPASGKDAYVPKVPDNALKDGQPDPPPAVDAAVGREELATPAVKAVDGEIITTKDWAKWRRDLTTAAAATGDPELVAQANKYATDVQHNGFMSNAKLAYSLMAGGNMDAAKEYLAHAYKYFPDGGVATDMTVSPDGKAIMVRTSGETDGEPNMFAMTPDSLLAVIGNFESPMAFAKFNHEKKVAADNKDFQQQRLDLDQDRLDEQTSHNEETRKLEREKFKAASKKINAEVKKLNTETAALTTGGGMDMEARLKAANYLDTQLMELTKQITQVKGMSDNPAEDAELEGMVAKVNELKRRLVALKVPGMEGMGEDIPTFATEEEAKKALKENPKINAFRIGDVTYRRDGSS